MTYKAISAREKEDLHFDDYGNVEFSHHVKP